MSELRSRARSFVRRHPLFASWALAGVFLWLSRLFLRLVGSGASALFSFLLFLWAIASVVGAGYWIWRKLTYRIGVRLFISYVVIGVVPFLIMTAFAAVIGYALAGQYTSVRYGHLEQRVMWELGRLAEDAASVWQQDGIEAALGKLRSSAANPPTPLPSVDWAAVRGTSSWTSRTGGAPLPPEQAAEAFRGAVATDAGHFFVAVEPVDSGSASGTVTLALAINQETARALGDPVFFELRFVLDQDNDGNFEVDTVNDSEPPGATINDDSIDIDDLEAGWMTLLVGEGSLRERLRILWFRRGENLVNWAENGSGESESLVTLVRAPVSALVSDLFDSRYELQDTFIGVVAALATAFFLVYLSVTALAGLLIFNVTRSAARLSHGARTVGAGDLSYRIPVRQRDQLGDLAVSFNSMAESVQGMVQGIAEKERLARELELAREIQASLLPPLEQEHGVLSVRAHFEPADEVGGDYLDVFPLEGDRLLIAAGDVAGHGLATSLLMTMVKSAVAILVAEGHGKTEILERLNDLVRRHPGRWHMVTLALTEIVAGQNELRIVSAGHPPAYVLSPSGELREARTAALPLGSSWLAAPEPVTLPFPPGSRLVLYSDGLVEATDDNDDPFGYERLESELIASRSLDAQALLQQLLGSLRAYAGTESLDDDLTLVVVEHRV